MDEMTKSELVVLNRQLLIDVTRLRNQLSCVPAWIVRLCVFLRGAT